MVVRTFSVCKWFCSLHSARRSSAQCYFVGWCSQYLLTRGSILTYSCKLTPFALRSVFWPSICSGHSNVMWGCFCCDQMCSYVPGLGYGLDKWGIVVRFQAGAKIISSPYCPQWLSGPISLLLDGCWRLFDRCPSNQIVQVTTHFHQVTSSRMSGAMAPLPHTPSWFIQEKFYFHVLSCAGVMVDCVWNVMAHAQKPDFVFRRNGRVNLNWRWRQISRLLAAEVCASAVVMLDAPCSEVVWRVLATYSILQFPLHFLSRASPCAITSQLDSTSFCDNTCLQKFVLMK